MLEIVINNDSGSPAYDDVCLTEHWCNNLEKDYVNLNGFKLADIYCRETHKRGGACIYVKNSIKIKSLCTNQFTQEMIVEIAGVELIELRTIIICIYRVPQSDFNIFKESLESLLDKISKLNKNVVICGDINVDWLEQNNHKDELCVIMNYFNLNAIVNSPTRITTTKKSALDQFFISKQISSFNVNIFNPGFSDHEAQEVHLTLTKKQTDLNYEVRYKRIFNDTNISYFKFLLSRENWDTLYHNENESTENIFNEFYDTIIHNFNIAFPRVLIRNKKQKAKSWVTDKIRTQSNTLKFLNKIVNLTRSKTVSLRYKIFKRKYKEEIKTAKVNYFNAKIENSLNKSRLTWKLINKTIGNNSTYKSKQNITLTINNEIVKNPFKIANQFNDYFINVGSNMNNTQVFRAKPTCKNEKTVNYPTMFLGPASEIEILEIVARLKTSNATGLDEIPNDNENSHRC